jgi:hypothetical protein
MVRGGPQAISAPCNIVLDSCSVRAKRGGDLVGPNPTDRGKPGTKYHVVVDADGLPLAAVASAANVNDTRLLRHLLNRAFVPMSATRLPMPDTTARIIARTAACAAFCP